MVFSSDLTFNGTTLLAGVTEADKPGSPWWSASGTLLPTPVYDTTASHAENHAGKDTHNIIDLSDKSRIIEIQGLAPCSSSDKRLISAKSI